MCLNILGLNIAKLSLLAFVNGPRMNFIFNLEGHVSHCLAISAIVKFCHLFLFRNYFICQCYCQGHQGDFVSNQINNLMFSFD